MLLVSSVLVWTVLLSGRAFAMRSLAGIVLELLAAFGQRECKLALVFEALDPGTAADLDFRFLKQFFNHRYYSPLIHHRTIDDDFRLKWFEAKLLENVPPSALLQLDELDPTRPDIQPDELSLRGEHREQIGFGETLE